MANFEKTVYAFLKNKKEEKNAENEQLPLVINITREAISHISHVPDKYRSQIMEKVSRSIHTSIFNMINHIDIVENTSYGEWCTNYSNEFDIYQGTLLVEAFNGIIDIDLISTDYLPKSPSNQPIPPPNPYEDVVCIIFFTRSNKRTVIIERVEIKGMARKLSITAMFVGAILFAVSSHAIAKVGQLDAVILDMSIDDRGGNSKLWGRHATDSLSLTEAFQQTITRLVGNANFRFGDEGVPFQVVTESMGWAQQPKSLHAASQFKPKKTDGNNDHVKSRIAYSIFLLENGTPKSVASTGKKLRTIQQIIMGGRHDQITHSAMGVKKAATDQGGDTGSFQVARESMERDQQPKSLHDAILVKHKKTGGYKDPLKNRLVYGSSKPWTARRELHRKVVLSQMDVKLTGDVGSGADDEGTPFQVAIKGMEQVKDMGNMTEAWRQC